MGQILSSIICRKLGIDQHSDRKKDFYMDKLRRLAFIDGMGTCSVILTILIAIKHKNISTYTFSTIRRLGV